MNENSKADNTVKKNTHTLNGTTPMPSIENMPSNVNIATHYSDMMQMITNSEGITTLHFYSRQPGYNIEECRIALPNRVVIEIASVIKQVLGEYQQPAPKL